MKRMEDRLGRVALIAALLMACATPAMAQDAKPADKGAEDAQEKEELDPNDPLYWSKMRGIQTIQRRTMQKVGRLGITGYTGMIPNNIFQRYYPVGLRLNYFILEGIGVELAGSYTLQQDTGLTRTLEDKQGVAAAGVLLGDQQLGRVNFGITWSPLFGKTSFSNRALNYFDMYVFGGFGMLAKQTQGDFGAAPTVGYTPEGALGGGFMYFLNTDMLVRLDFRQFIFQKVTGGVANPTEISVGFTYML